MIISCRRYLRIKESVSADGGSLKEVIDASAGEPDRESGQVLLKVSMLPGDVGGFTLIKRVNEAISHY